MKKETQAINDQVETIRGVIENLLALTGRTGGEMFAEGGDDALARGLQLAMENMGLHVVPVGYLDTKEVMETMGMRHYDGPVHMALGYVSQCLRFYGRGGIDAGEWAQKCVQMFDGDNKPMGDDEGYLL